MIDVTALAAEFKNDPESIGYKNPDGTFKTVREIAHLLLVRPMVPNPNPQPQLPKPIDTNQLMSLVSPSTIAAADYLALKAIEEAADSGDRGRLQRQFQVWQAKGWLSDPTEIQAIQNELTATIPDPNWQPMVPGQSRLEQLFGETVIGYDKIETALSLAQL